MPIERLIDPASYDPAAITVPIESLRAVIPQRGNFEQLDGLLELSPERELIVGVRHVPQDSFWIPDHMPGRPLLPGAFMLDALAQLGIYYFHTTRPPGDERLFGFGGLDAVTFRRPVRPGETIIYAARPVELRSRRARFHGQGFVGGHCVVDGIVAGVPILADA